MPLRLLRRARREPLGAQPMTDFTESFGIFPGSGRTWEDVGALAVTLIFLAFVGY